MPRTKSPKHKSYNGPFPLQKDKTFLSLTPKQQKFVYNIYLKPTSGWSNAYCYANAYGHEVDVAQHSACASENLNKPKIAYCVQILKEQHAANLGYSAARVLEEIGHLALSDIAEYFDENGYLTTNPKDLPESVRRAIQSISKVYDKNGDPKWEVKLWSKPEALKLLTKINGMDAPKKVELSGPGGKPIQVNQNITHSLDLSGLDDDEMDILLKLVERNETTTEKE